ncbi:MAG: ATP-dependent RecD-like DNA helicase [Oceanobacter sp.]
MLRHRAFRGFGFGDKKIDKLIRSVGNEHELIRILNHEKNWIHLKDILAEPIAKKLILAWRKVTNESQTMEFLVKHKFQPQLANKIIGLAKENTVERLTSNPYALLAFNGIAKNIWKTVDECGRNLEIENDDPRRLVGAIEHVMYKRLQQGHTAATYEEVIEQATKLLRTKNRASKALEAALSKHAICMLKSNGERLYQAVGPAHIEYSLENRLKRLLNGAMQYRLLGYDESEVALRVQEYASHFAEERGYPLTSEQHSAIEMALTKRCSVITGFGGTGKTTVLRAVVDVANQLGSPVYCMALAGKAKERIVQTTGAEASTIHSFILSAMLSQIEGKKTFVDLNCDPLLIIDEASMIDIALFNRLLSLFDGKSFSLLTVGDPAQLSPVGFGLAWHRMVDSHIPMTRLTIVHRQVSESALHRVAMHIRNGEEHQLPVWDEEAREGAFFVDATKDSLENVLAKIKKKLPNAQLLTPHVSERLPDSSNKLNRVLQMALNASAINDDFIDSRPGFRVGRNFIREGDPVLVTENSYEIGVFNGTTGKMITITRNKDGALSGGAFTFDDREGEVSLTVEQCYDIGLSLGYAISIHKSQGSEYEQAIITNIVTSDFVERSILYTALTRSKTLCLIVGKHDVYRQAVVSKPRAETLRVGFTI